MYSSGSSDANRRELQARVNQGTASVAAFPASFQPENAATIAGRRNEGSTFQRTVTPAPHVRLTGRRRSGGAREPPLGVHLVERDDLRAERTERVERLRPGPLAGRVLVVTGRDVVTDGEARNEREGLVDAHVPRPARDEDD